MHTANPGSMGLTRGFGKSDGSPLSMVKWKVVSPLAEGVQNDYSAA